MHDFSTCQEDTWAAGGKFSQGIWRSARPEGGPGKSVMGTTQSGGVVIRGQKIAWLGSG